LIKENIEIYQQQPYWIFKKYFQKYFP